MKRTYPAFALLNAAGRMVDIAITEDRLYGREDCDAVVRCRVVLEPERKFSRLGRAAQARRQAGGRRVIGRPSVSVEEWTRRKGQLWKRCHGRCEIPGCHLGETVDPHHVPKTGQGAGDEPWQLVALCRWHHEQTDIAVDKGRLEIVSSGCHLGLYGFRFYRWTVDRLRILGTIVFYDTNDEPAPEDTADKFWRLFGGPPPVAKITRSVQSPPDSVTP